MPKAHSTNQLIIGVKRQAMFRTRYHDFQGKHNWPPDPSYASNHPKNHVQTKAQPKASLKSLNQSA